MLHIALHMQIVFGENLQTGAIGLLVDVLMHEFAGSGV